MTSDPTHDRFVTPLDICHTVENQQYFKTLTRLHQTGLFLKPLHFYYTSKRPLCLMFKQSQKTQTGCTETAFYQVTSQHTVVTYTL